MNELGGAQRFAQLSAEDQARYIAISQQLAGLARDHAVPIIFAPPLSIGGKINGACGCVLQLNAGIFVVTASHVLGGYEDRVRSGEVLNWQVGDLPPFDPIPRIAWRDMERDIVLLRISDNEAQRIGPCTISSPPNWPPSLPQEGQVVLVAGYPKALREDDPSSGRIGAGPYSAVFRVTKVGESYCKCLIERKDLISFNGGPLPEPGTEMGGLSGGPVLLLGALSYPLVGIVTDRCEMSFAELEILTFATLESVIMDENAAVGQSDS
jgi:Trypsin-like peptidase domain